MNIQRILTKPTRAEIDSFVLGYSHAPWLETNDPAEIEDYLAGYRNTGSVALGVREGDETPYLYTHFRTYDDIDTLVNEEFVGEHAFYVATSPGLISAALEGQDRVSFISNVNADKEAPVEAKNKPRLKVFSTVIDACFEMTGASCVAYYTHPATGVYRYTNVDNLPNYNIEETPYPVEPSGHNDITSLVLFALTPKEVAETAA